MKNGDEAADIKNKPKVPYSSYKEFLENYNTKKFSPVRPAVPMQQQQEKKTMKSEIFIQVNGDNKEKEEKRVVVVPVSSNRENNPLKRVSAPPPPPPPPQFVEIKPSPVQKITQNKTTNNVPTPPPPPPVPEFLENLLKKRAAALQKMNEAEFNTTTYVPVIDETDRVDKNDPNVKKLVYNTYRGLLGAYNNKANDIISTLPRHCVREDRGIAKQLESIA